MKITRSQLKQLIKEEISSAQEALVTSRKQRDDALIGKHKGITNAFHAPSSSGAYGPDDDYHTAYDEWSEHSVILDRFKSETNLDPDENPDVFFAWIRDQEKVNPVLSTKYSRI
jgi:hypothetical protein